MEETKKIYVGNLEYAVTEDILKNFMTEKGINPTQINIIMDKFSGRPKGFGFAEFATEEEAQKAIDALNGQELNGRPLKVSKAQKMEPRSRDSFDGGSRDKFGGGGRDHRKRGGRF